jgi:hypothetical protein
MRIFTRLCGPNAQADLPTRWLVFRAARLN